MAILIICQIEGPLEDRPKGKCDPYYFGYQLPKLSVLFGYHRKYPYYLDTLKMIVRVHCNKTVAICKAALNHSMRSRLQNAPMWH